MTQKKVKNKTKNILKSKYPKLDSEKWIHVPTEDGLNGYAYNDDNSSIRKVVHELEDNDTELDSLPIENISDILKSEESGDIERYYNSDPNVTIYLGTDAMYTYEEAFVNAMFKCDDKRKLKSIYSGDDYDEDDKKELKFKNYKDIFGNEELEGTKLCKLRDYEIYMIGSIEREPTYVISKDNIIVTLIVSWSCVCDGDSGFEIFKYGKDKIIGYGYGDATSLMVIDLNHPNSEIVDYKKNQDDE